VGVTLEVDRLTKRFGSVVAVDDLSFRVEPGTVTGFLGPNGAGKTTTLRALLGLVAPTSGQTRISGARYRDLPHPIQTVGAVLEASDFHPGRTARNHLRILCTAAGLPPGRVEETLSLVAMTDVADRRVRGYSLGMRQRLGLAAALLGDPEVLILDEPGNGLDPGGMAWLRGFLRHLAEQGRTVLVSSHVLAEVAQTVDQVIIIARGRLVTQSSLDALTTRAVQGVRVRTGQPSELLGRLRNRGLAAQLGPDGEVIAPGADPEAVGRVLAEGGIVITEMTAETQNLEEIFLELTGTGAPASPTLVAGAIQSPPPAAPDIGGTPPPPPSLPPPPSEEGT
jgi:ABC-2 type transport system ATP-binding protein